MAAALKSITLLLLLPQMTQTTGELSTLSSSQRASQPESRQGNKQADYTEESSLWIIQNTSNWTDELELKPRKKEERYLRRKKPAVKGVIFYDK